MNEVIINQCGCPDAQFAVIGSCVGFGNGVISWHQDEISAHQTKRNLQKLGGSVSVMPTPKGYMDSTTATLVKDLVMNA